MNMWERMLALILLLLLSPLMLLIAIAIYIFEPGAPIFYSGIRIG
ncbi:sugar transferase, partial [bacterium]|nr:sugar transferase [bacterium]